MPAVPPKRLRPESPAQAQSWDRVFNRYKRDGFCPVDAAQAAWGHQIGFAHTHEVRDCCRGRALPPENDNPRSQAWVTGEIVPADSVR